MYIGIDDTDSVKGMCTTYLTLEVVKEFQDELDLIGYPRLVRLNPNIPWKTRGNGAICLRLGKGTGKPSQVGWMDNEKVFMYDRESKRKGDREIPRPKDVLERVTSIVERLAHLDINGTNSAVVVTRRKPPRFLYTKAVREVVRISEARASIPKTTLFKAFGNRRGLIGAIASISWTPKDRTYEVLAYREIERWGTKRKVNIEDVKALDDRFPLTFNNYDPRNKHAAIVPATPCPILFGIRGEAPGPLPAAMRSIGSEPKDRWIIYVTNQGTGDHMVKRTTLARYTSGIFRAQVVNGPKDIKGGHVILTVKALGSGRRYPCAAYEPTKEFRAVVRKLVPGDVITIFGSRGASNPDTVNIEKLKVEKLRSVRVKVGNPVCPDCGKSMKSTGRGAGYKCRRCGTRRKEVDARYQNIDRELDLKTYEVPIGARRHLHKPNNRWI